MSGDAPYIVFYVLAIALVASSLFGMRLAPGKAAKMVLAWVGIFAVVFTIFAFRSEVGSFAQRLRAEATGAPIVAGEAVRVPISDDGHFWVTARVNGHELRFMVDSGASVTTISEDAAQSAGIPSGTRRVPVSTANGTILVAASRAEEVTLGPIQRRDLAVHVTDAVPVNLLGMNFLSLLSSWRVEGNYLVLQP
jgi:aspartyl protease family protein